MHFSSSVRRLFGCRLFVSRLLVSRLGGAVCTLAGLTACATGVHWTAVPWPDDAGAFDLGGSALVIHSAGWDELFSDPRDAGLRRALGFLDERLVDLVEESGDHPPPPGAIEFLCQALSEPWTLRVNFDAPGPIPVRATWTVEPAKAEDAVALATRFAEILALTGLPTTTVANHPALSEIQLPQGSLFHGTVDKGSGGDEGNGGKAFLVAWGEPEDDVGTLGSAGLPAGVRTGFAFGLDLGALRSVLERFLPDTADGERLRKELALAGLNAEPPTRFTFSAGHGRDRVHLASRYANWTPTVASLGALADGPIPPEALALVPYDATFVSIQRGEPSMLLRYLEALAPDDQDELDETLGIALGPDLLEPLGQTLGLYLSNTTGGGDLGSAVAFVAVDDEAHLARTLDTLAARGNEAAREKTHGRLRIGAFEHGGARGYQLDFPGLPVPLSPSVALSHGYLFVAATPQALDAALDQAREGGYRSDFFGWRAQVEQEGLGSLDDLQGLTYLDVPDKARIGYGAAALLAATLANGVRSRGDEARDPGRVMPSFAELIAPARPTVLLARIRGPDLVTVGSTDRSALTHLAAALGWTSTVFTAITALSASVALVAPAVVERLDDAESVKVRADLWNLCDALDSYAIEHGGKYPDTLDALLEPDQDGLAWLEEIPSDPWGNPYVYELDGENMRVLSYGSDGVPGGEGTARDIDSDEVRGGESMDEDEDDSGMDEGNLEPHGEMEEGDEEGDGGG